MGENVANHTSDKGVGSRIQKNPACSTIKTQIAWAKDLNRNFLKENIKMVNKHRTRSSTLLVIMEMQNKTTMNYHFIPIRMAEIRR